MIIRPSDSDILNKGCFSSPTLPPPLAPPSGLRSNVNYHHNSIIHHGIFVQAQMK